MIPRCRLTGQCLTRWLPNECPLASGYALQVLHTWQCEGYRLLGEGDSEGLTLLEIGRVCGGCIDRIAADPHIARLRARVVSRLCTKTPVGHLNTEEARGYALCPRVQPEADTTQSNGRIRRLPARRGVKR